MNKNIIHVLPKIFSGMAAMIMLSCGSADEVPPRNEQATTVKSYKMPDPTPLSNDDKAAINAIKDEYKQAVGEE